MFIQSRYPSNPVLLFMHGGPGMPVTSLQRYLGHEDLDTTMLYAEVTDPLLQKDY